MLNEGMITGDQRTLIKSEMMRALTKAGRVTAKAWEGAVFEALTGNSRDEVDWDAEDNKAGYFLWLKAFDQLVEELRGDGYVLVEGDSRERTFLPAEREDDVRYSEGVSHE